MQLFQNILFDFCLFELDTVQIICIGQVRYHKLIGDLVLLIFIGIDYHPRVESSNGARYQHISHTDPSIRKSQSYTIHNCTLCTSFVLEDSY